MIALSILVLAVFLLVGWWTCFLRCLLKECSKTFGYFTFVSGTTLLSGLAVVSMLFESSFELFSIFVIGNMMIVIAFAAVAINELSKQKYESRCAYSS